MKLLLSLLTLTLSPFEDGRHRRHLSSRADDDGTSSYYLTLPIDMLERKRWESVPLTYRQLRRDLTSDRNGIVVGIGRQSSSPPSDPNIHNTTSATSMTSSLLPRPMLTEKTEFWKERRRRRRTGVCVQGLDNSYDRCHYLHPRRKDRIKLSAKDDLVVKIMKRHKRRDRHHGSISSKTNHQKSRLAIRSGGSVVIREPTTNRKVCERIKVPMCQGMPYNVTKMPNYFHEATQQNVKLVMDKYKLLVRLRNNCSSILTFFLCSLYVPMCDAEFFTQDSSGNSDPYPSQPNLYPLPGTLEYGQVDDEFTRSHRAQGFLSRDPPPQIIYSYGSIDMGNEGSGMILPCQHVCSQARASCEPLLNRFNVSWPTNLLCDNFPSYQRGICISPQAIVKGPSISPHPGTGSTSVVEGGGRAHDRIRKVKSSILYTDGTAYQQPSPSSGCKCLHHPKLKQKNFYNRRYDYALRIHLLKYEKLDGLIDLKVVVKDVLMRSSIDIPVGEEFSIWMVSSCMCPEMEISKDYLIMGYEDTDIQALLYFTKKGIAMPWKDRMKNKVQVWGKRMKQKLKHEKNYNTTIRRA